MAGSARVDHVDELYMAGGFAGVNAPPLTYGHTLNYQTAP
jgi:hypothetical protein